MKVAVIGSRGLHIDHLERYLPPETTEIVSGGAKGIDTCAKEYALAHNLKLTEFRPNYRRYQKAAPLIRNVDIVHYADHIVIFWDGRSHGTYFVIQFCKEEGDPFTLYQPGESCPDLHIFDNRHYSLIL